jgi:membrane fusion protein, multidrug efflux system
MKLNSRPLSSRSRRSILITGLALGAGLVLAGGRLATASGEEPLPAPPPVQVSVVTVKPQTVEEELEFLGEVEAFRSIQVRAEVAGVITDRPFREGTQARAGEVLYRIDRTTYDADYRGARARLVQAQAQLSIAQTTVDRYRPLLAENAVAKLDVDNAEAALQEARAMVDDTRAAVDFARKNLEETVVRAEIAGRVGRALLDVGARVSGSSDVLTTLDVIDPVYVSFRPAAQQQFRWKRDQALRRAIEPGGSARVQVLLPDSTPYPTVGRIGFIDPVVDPQTGTQQFRAELANAERLLLPGQFVRVRLLGLERADAIAIPQRAVLQQLSRQIVYVVDTANKVAARDVVATGWSGSNRLIESGLTAGDRVVVDGLQKIGPGATVRPSEAKDDAAAKERR